MRTTAVLAASLALGTAGGFVAAMVASPPPPAAAPRTGVGDAGPSTAAARLDRLERRVDELAAGMASRAAAPTAPAAPSPAGAEGEAPAAPSASAPPSDRLEALESRVAVLEKAGPRGTPIPADLSKVPVSQLEALVRNLTMERRYPDSMKVAEELLRREDLTPEQRLEGEMQVGYGLRGLGRNAEAEARFRESLARVGENTEQAPWLGFQIAWERSYQKDLAGGIQEMEKAANHPLVQPLVRVHALYNAGNFARQAGDAPRARAFLERLLNQHAGDIIPSQAHMRTQAEAWLKEVSGE